MKKENIAVLFYFFYFVWLIANIVMPFAISIYIVQCLINESINNQDVIILLLVCIKMMIIPLFGNFIYKELKEFFK
jgi:hypothetical protein